MRSIGRKSVDDVFPFFKTDSVRWTRQQPLSGCLLKRAVWVLLVAFLWQSPQAFAGDFTVAYAFEVGDQIETGKMSECEYRYFCTISLKKLGLYVDLSFWDPKRNMVVVGAHGDRRPNCCFFADGARSVSRSARSMIRLNVYEGHARRGNEFVRNAPFGVLNLQFSDMK